MKKNFLTLLLIFLGVFILTLEGGFRVAFAETSNNSKNIENIFQNAKEALDNLIFTKDSGKLDDVSSRVKALNQVLDLSIAEAKDYASKLVAVPKNKDYNEWVEKSIKTLSDYINFYNDEKKSLQDTPISLEDVKKKALDFKDWREKEYLPFIRSLQTFLLITQQENALGIASKRLINIKKDLSKISFKAKDKKIVDAYIASSSENIKNAEEFNKKAYEKFLEIYVKKNENVGKSEVKSEEDSLRSENLEITSSTLSSKDDKKNDSQEIKSEANNSLSEEKKEKFSDDESIRVLVKSSLDEIKRAYQNFIDLSNYVRKLLK
jgi:hypothetical protein